MATLSMLSIRQMRLVPADCCDHFSFCDILRRGKTCMVQWMTQFVTSGNIKI